MTTIAVDDRDSRISYSGEWHLYGSEEEFGSSTHGSAKAGSRATFTFTGTSVAVYGSISNSVTNPMAAESSYSVDGANFATYRGAPGSTNQYRQRFYQSPKLSAGEHTLVITATFDNAFFWLDYIEYTPGGEAVPSPNRPNPSPSPQNEPPSSQSPPRDTTITTATIVQSGPTGSSNNAPAPSNADSNSDTSTRSPISTSAGDTSNTSTNSSSSNNGGGGGSGGGSGSSGVTTINGIVTIKQSQGTQTSITPQSGSSQMPTSSAAAIASSGSRVPVGAIAGGVIGGVILLAAIIIFALWFRRRKRTNHTTVENSALPTNISPFTRMAPGSTPTVLGKGGESSGYSPAPLPEKKRMLDEAAQSADAASSTGLLNAQQAPSEVSTTSYDRNASSTPSGAHTGPPPTVTELPQSIAGPPGGYPSTFDAELLYQNHPVYPDDIPPAYRQSNPEPLRSFV